MIRSLQVCMLVGLLAAARVPITPPAPGASSDPPSETPEFDDAAGRGDTTAVLTGTVTYRQRVALPEGSMIEVQLQDVSRADAPAQIIASQTITTTGKYVPISFSLVCDLSAITERFTYALNVRITKDGQLRWINPERYAVLTHGAPKGGVEVVVEPVQ